MKATQYDYIFLGTGAATLSIVMRMIMSEKFADKNILLTDKNAKKANDRTWCFWEKEKGFFEEIVYHIWDALLFTADDETIPLDTGDYQYKMIRGIDFYEHCFALISKQKNIDIACGTISFVHQPANTVIYFNNEILQHSNEAVIFNAVYDPLQKDKDAIHLLQHFKGWIINTPNHTFAPKVATLMDFRVAQSSGTTFVYVLPLSAGSALIEYTLFSEKLLDKSEYDVHLSNYIEHFLDIKKFSVTEEEFGVIPMTDEHFAFYKNGMYHIGTAGGQTKASTGYTFSFIQKQAEKIVQALVNKDSLLQIKKTKKRFLFYDSTLLHILSKKLMEGKRIFTILFKKNKASIIFTFLNNETTLGQEMRLLNTLPKKIFIKAGFLQFIKMMLRTFKGQ